MPKRVAIDIQSEVQYFSIAPLLSEISKIADLTIVTGNLCSGDSTYEKITKKTESLLADKNIESKSFADLGDCQFDVCICPYYSNHIKAKFYLKYEYGTLNIKPSLTYTPQSLRGLHGFLCQSTITERLLSAYGLTFPVDNLRFDGYTRKKEKNTILFAPTYNDDKTISDYTDIIKNLQSAGYKVLVKGHHGTEYLEQNAKKRNILVSLADEYYGPDTCLSELIMRAEVCLFGNSSAIGEALYANVPCAIFAHDLDSFALESIHTSQYHFAKDNIIPHCSNSKTITTAIKKAQEPEIIALQKRLSESVFPARFKTRTTGYINAISLFLNNEDGLMDEYANLSYIAKQKEIDDLHKDIKKLEKELQLTKQALLDCQPIIDSYNNGKLHKIARKLYELEGKILNGKS